MPDIIVDDEEAQAIFASNAKVPVRDRGGRLIGWITPSITADELQEIERRWTSAEPWRTTEQVLEHLRNLEEQGL